MLVRTDETLNTANVSNVTASIYRADQKGPSVTTDVTISMPFKGNYVFTAVNDGYTVSVVNPFVAAGDDVTVTSTGTIGTVEVKNGEVVIPITGAGDVTVNVA